MTSTVKNCAVLHCESGSSSDVEFFDFPQPNDPRYAIWVERTLQGSQWTPSSTSTICSRHFRAADILTTEAADDSGRSEKRLKYDALPCVFECLPESERPQAAHVPRPDSPEIVYQAPKQRGLRTVVIAGVSAVNAASLPTSSVDEDPSACCVPGCPSRRSQGVLLRGAPRPPTIRFHAFPSGKQLHWEWTKRVRCSVSWRPAPFSVVCSAHFSSTDYHATGSGMLCLKSTAIPSQLASVGVFMMRKREGPGPSDRMCAICGCWRMKNQRQYKAAARLAFVPFPTDPDERKKWNALRKDISSDADLFACENHFLLTEIVSRFQKNGEENCQVRSGVVPRVEPTLWLDPQSSPSSGEIPRASAVENVRSPPNQAEIPVPVQSTVNNTQTPPKLVVLFRNGIPSHNVQLHHTQSKLPIPKNVLSVVVATEVCCVPGCPVTTSNAGEKDVSVFRFISRVDSRYSIWINRIRCATTWALRVDKHPLAICSRHFLPSDFDPRTLMVSANALPNRLSCISAFHFSGLREGETDVTGMLKCVVCFAKRKPGLSKSSEWLKFFPLPADPVQRAAWCKFASAETVIQNFDTDSLICENHFLPTDFTSGGEALKPSVVPSCTFRLQPEFTPLPSLAYIRIPMLKVKTVSITSGTKPIGPTAPTENPTIARSRCCVTGCQNVWKNKREKNLTFFKFVAADEPRYEIWLERVRPDPDWIPDSTTLICSDHFLPSQVLLRVSVGATKRILSKTALPSLLNGECRWQPSELQLESAEELKPFDCDCCVPGCENKRGKLGSKEVKFFTFVAANDPRYDTWLHRVRPDNAWIPDIHTRICSEHFFATQIWRRKNGKGEVGAVLSDFALPSRLNGETKWEPSDIKLLRPKRKARNTNPKRQPRHADRERASCKCCVVGCGNVRGYQKVHFFPFPGQFVPRYKIWLERVRPNDSWTPDSQTRVCSAHFLPSQLEKRKSGRNKKTVLNCRALPSLLNGECIWEPNELLDGTVTRPSAMRPSRRIYFCCVSGCGSRSGDSSKKVSLFKFIKPEDPRYETWLQRVKPEADWIPDGDTRICGEHFLPSQIKTHRGKMASRLKKGKERSWVVLSRTSLPSQLDGKTMWEPADFRSLAEMEMEQNGTRRFLFDCCVPGCENTRKRIGSKNVSFFKFITPDEARYSTWLRRIQYKSAWIPQTGSRVCSDHFLELDFVWWKERGTMRFCPRPTAIPSQLSCMTALCGFTESDMISEKIGCVACGLIPLSTNRELKESERLQFFRTPVGELKTKWIDFIGTQATQIDSGRLAESASWFVCENHFHPESFEPQSEGVHCLSAEAVPSLPFSLELEYIEPMLKLWLIRQQTGHFGGVVAKQPKREQAKPNKEQTRLVDASSVQISNPSSTCVVPGCPMASRIACRSSSERITFHIFPTRSSARSNEWVKRIRCAVSWSPNLHDRICNLHFLPDDFVEETSKGKQPRTKQTKKTAVPSKLECLERFRSPKGSNTTASEEDGQIQTCCICGCWRPMASATRYQRSERLTFFPFPTDEEQRELWTNVCRKVHPDLILSDESVICENHFRSGDFICVLENKKTTKLMLETNAVPSEQNFAWSNGDYDDDISESYLFDTPDVDMDETVEEGMVDHTETDYDDAVDSQLEDVSSMDENDEDTSLPFAMRWQTPPENGLPEDDAADTCINPMPDMPPPLPYMDDEPTKSPKPLLAVNSSLMYCANCQLFLETPCWLHSNTISDEPVISLAVGSLPNVLYMGVCNDVPNGKTIFAKDTVPRHTVFGPLVAPLTAEEDAGAQYFAVSEAGVGSRRKHYHLESDYACNWMKYVRFADSRESSNLLVFARGLEIVFVTSRTISTHEELRVWHSAQYTEMITDIKPFIPDLHLEREATAIKVDALEFVDIGDDGASSCGFEDNESDMNNVAFQNLPVTILPASAVPPLPETIQGDLDITQAPNRKKRGRTWREDTSGFFNRNICPECTTRFRSSGLLELHKYSHSQWSVTAERPERQCPDCRKEFATFDELLQHVNNHGTKLVRCPVCNDLCSTTALAVHVKRYHPESCGTGKRTLFLDCYECGLRFTNASLYRMHKHKHGASKNAESVQFAENCPECKEVFQDVGSLVDHAAEHGKSINKCPVCEEWYGALRGHMVYSHPSYPIPPVLPRLRTKELEVQRTGKRMKTLFHTMTCYECCLRFPTDLLYELHKCKHGNDEFSNNLQLPQKCPECDEMLEDLDRLVEHVDDHGTSIRKCPVCHHWFANLSKHIRHNHPAYQARHGSQREYRDKNGVSRTSEVFCTPCAECGMRFPTDYLCQLHNIRHGKSEEIVSDMELPTKCPHCDEMFEDLDELVEHVNFHGKLSQKCPVCDLWVGSLLGHMRLKHPDHEYVPFKHPLTHCENDSIGKKRIRADSAVQKVVKRLKTTFHRLTCYECRLRFPTELLHEFHRSRHESSDCTEWPEVCPECDVPFGETERPLDHIDKHARRVRKCHLCHQWCFNLTAHLRRAHPKNPGPGPWKIKRNCDGESTAHSLPCPDCGLRFTTDFLCGIHGTKHGREDYVLNMTFPKKCPDCDVVFAEREALVEHVDIHGKLSKKCPVCGVWLAELSKHMRSHHPEHSSRQPQINLTCLTCGVRFPTEILLQLHSVQHRNVEDREGVPLLDECPQCDLVFQDLSELSQHVDEHGTALHKCPGCKLWFSDVRSHMRYCRPMLLLKPEYFKQPQKDLTCLTCGVRFPTEILFRLHGFQHRTADDGEDIQLSNECPQCDQVFQELSELALHVDEHGTWLKKCPVCEQWYRRLRDHIRYTHPDYSKNLTCRDCGLRFQTDALYLLHKYKHAKTKDVKFPRKCPECGETFQEFASLMDHVEQHGKCMEKCPVCHQWYAALKEHMRYYHPVTRRDSCSKRRRSRKRSKPLQGLKDRHRLRKPPKTLRSTCQICDVCFPAEALCKLHTYTHGRKEYAESLQFPQECPGCCVVFEELSELVEHVEEHGERVENGKMQDDSFTEFITAVYDQDPVPPEIAATEKNKYSHKGHDCPECGKEFRLRIRLQAHVKTCRRKSKKCVICSEMFDSSSDFDRHVNSHETDDGFLCEICLATFPYYRLLAAHVEQHGSENPAGIVSTFNCILCHNGFVSPDELNEHAKGHEGRDGFTCAVCSETFPFYRLLAWHMSDEHGPTDTLAEYSCTICNSAFSRLNDLEIHLFTHDAELQFKCEEPQCGKRFASMKSLKGHVSGFHKRREASRHKVLRTRRKKNW